MASCLIDVYYHHSSISLRARLNRIVLIRNGAFDVFESTVGLVEIPDAILDRADTFDLNLGALLLLIFYSSQSLFNCSTIQGLLYICSQSTSLPLYHWCFCFSKKWTKFRLDYVLYFGSWTSLCQIRERIQKWDKRNWNHISKSVREHLSINTECLLSVVVFSSGEGMCFSVTIFWVLSSLSLYSDAIGGCSP